ncbi:alpha/beta-hydrolase, partial [Thozetella sp. PMI_491]
ELTTALQTVYSSPPTSIYDTVGTLIQAGLAPTGLLGVYTAYSSGDNSVSNSNPKPPTSCYPKSTNDAPFSVSESQLRQAIHIPSTFTYGQKPPVLFVPGTGVTGALSFGTSYIKLMTGSSYADPVWLNVPGFLNGDVQENSEYVAYAINYISSVSKGANVSVIAWSQGNINTHWAMKYWPSARALTSNHIAISPDFHGTTTGSMLCPSGSSCTPAILQQGYNSNLIQTLRNTNGDSAYVPTTTLFSSTYDEVVQPMKGTNASAYLNDARNVGVTNNEVQVICSSKPAGGFFTHEGMLYNNLGFALAVDALTNDGPGQPSRLALDQVCAQSSTTGLSIADLLAIENNVPIFLATTLLYSKKVTSEPAIKSYATY